MSVVGIDLGAFSTKIGVARNKGIDIVTNEVSNRATPSLVGFGPKSRYIGEAAKTQETSNFKNTVSSLKLLAGRTLSDPDVQIEQEYNFSKLVDVNGEAGAEVTYLGKKEQFSATQLTAMYLTKIKATASAELKLPVSDVVVSCPPWFTDTQRRAMLDAADIAGLKLLRLMNDTTAIALGYGITKLDLPTAEEKPRRVVFVDIGYCNYTCAVVEFRKGELTVKGSAYDRHFGGRYIDKAMVDHFAKEFKEKHKIDITTNKKALLRTFAAAEKLKKVLSANTSSPISIESLMNDVDVRTFMKREELEDLMRPLLDRVTVPLQQALADSELKPEDIDSIEMVGGCTRVPSIKEAITNFFGKPLSFTLNQDEAVSRGCTFACAILSPVFRVRDFSVYDAVNYPIEFAWEKDPDIPEEGTSLTVFNKGSVMPSTRILTFFRKRPFDVEARYAKPAMLPGKTNPWIGRFSVKNVAPAANNEFMICKLKARFDLHGILNIESGYYVENVEVEEPIPEEKKEGDTMDTDAPNGEGEAEAKPKMRKVKKQVRKGDLAISVGTSSLDETTIARFNERENAMFMEDKLVADTEDKKNELESYIYETRDKIDTIYAEFSSEEEKEKIKEKLTATEDWLYEDGEDTTKAVYTAKFDEIRFLVGPIIQRHQDKIDAARQTQMKAQEEVAAKKAAEIEAKKREEESKKNAEDEKKKEADTEMKDAGAENKNGDTTMEEVE